MTLTKPGLFKLWASMIGLHALHQIEESISFFKWEMEQIGKVPDWLIINLKLLKWVGEYKQSNFFISSFFQIFIISFIAWIFRKNIKITKRLMLLYLTGLFIVFCYHILASIVAESPAPVMVTCIGGLYSIPFLASRVLNFNRSKDITDES